MKALALAALITAAPLPALGCGLELILAMDVSGSIDQNEYALQAGGLADAFESPALAAAVAGLEGGMIVTVTQWSGASRQRQVTGWRRLITPEDLAGFAKELRGTGRSWKNYSTAVGEALVHAREVSAGAPADCLRRVIDVSGDGVSNEGRDPKPVSDALAAEGYVINGLVIQGAAPDPVTHFEHEVIAGPGAFVEVARDFDDYPRAILKKLLKEIDRPLLVSEAE